MWLGATRSHDKVRRFRKNDKRDIVLDISTWLWALKNALPVGSNISVSTIRLPLSLRAPTLVLYRDKHERMYEGITPNTVLTFPVFFTACPPPNVDEGMRAPTLEEFKQLLSFVGERVGLSPYRSEEGWGRFKVESIKENDSEKDS